MAKGPWESRVGLLLRPDTFVWKYKAPDSQFYGGQPRVDWVACDMHGTFWMIEVKQAGAKRQSITIETEITEGQQEALTTVASTSNGVALLAIGKDRDLYIHDWRRVCRLMQERDLRIIPLMGPSLLTIFHWTGPKTWKENNLYNQVLFSLDPAHLLIPWTVTVPDYSSPGTAR